MTMISRIETLVAILCLGGGLAACTTQESTSGGTGGGIIPTGTGGTGAGGAGGAAGNAGVLCPTLAESITDFETATAPDATQIRFGGAGVQGGGASVWGLTSAIVGGTWHLSGTVADYAGFNIYFDNCTLWNASAFKGISFTLSGTAANLATPLTFAAPTVNNTTSAAWLISQGDTQAKTTDIGSCTPTSGNGRYYHPGCADASKSIAVPTAPTTISVLWSDFTGGQPDVSPKPDQITGIYWNLQWGGAGSTPYAADFTIDNLKFIP